MPLEITYRNASRVIMNDTLTNLNRLNNRNLLFTQIRDFDNTNLNTIEFQFVEFDNFRSRVYYIQNLDIDSSDTKSLQEEVNPRVRHALKDIEKEASLNIKFHWKGLGEFHEQKSFNEVELSDVNKFWGLYRKWLELSVTAREGTDYTRTVQKIVMRIIRPNAGGCEEKREINKRYGAIKMFSPKSSNNNCFFSIFKEELKLPKTKASIVVCNKIRAEFGIPKNTMLTAKKAIDIAKKYKLNITIKDMDSKRTYKSFPKEQKTATILNLENNHYKRVIALPRLTCEKCLKTYFVKHTTCLTKKVQFTMKMRGEKGRALLTKKVGEIKNTQKEIIHFDLETYRKTENGNEVHTPYIVGYTELDKKTNKTKFKTIKGDDCVKNFVSRLLRLNKIANEEFEKTTELKDRYIKEAEEAYENNPKPILEERKNFMEPKEEEEEEESLELKKKFELLTELRKIKIFKKKIFVNAYNGAGFDHFFIFQDFLRRGVKPDRHIVNNGSIISFRYQNIILMDFYKHMQGSLAKNLEASGCETRKGDFDHENASKWEIMTPKLRKECILYLKSDVMGLRELYNKINTAVYDEYKVNLSSYISTSSLTFNLWKSHINGKYDIRLPNQEQEDAFRQAIRGGRTYKTKHGFRSNQYDSYQKGETKFEEIKDYLIDADVVSLYPSAMLGLFPTGRCFKWEKPKEKNTPLKMGIYHISYKTNKSLAHSISGRRGIDGSLKWDLVDCEDWATSVDIEDMRENGYTVKIISGFYWEKKEKIYESYVKELYKKKKANIKGSPMYNQAKLWLNGLYGKNLQRPIYNKTIIIENNRQYWQFWSKHIINDITEIKVGDTSFWSLSGKSRFPEKVENAITKPTHLGAFILAYSRRIMVNYMKEANPYFDSKAGNLKKQIDNDIYYTDTDSLQMHVNNAKLMGRFGDKELGGITDDLGDGCKIIRGIWIAPKLYMLEYLKQDNKGEITKHYHFRGKGLNKDSLTVKSFEDMSKGHSLTNIRNFSMKKIHTKRNSKQQDIKPFSIIHYNRVNNESRLTRVVNSKPWAGRAFIGNFSIAHT
jgi:hypothetical protein